MPSLLVTNTVQGAGGRFPLSDLPPFICSPHPPLCITVSDEDGDTDTESESEGAYAK